MIDIRADENRVVVGPQEALLAAGCLVEDVNYVALAEVSVPLAAHARIRSHAADVPVTLLPADDGRLAVRFDEPQRAVTPGQSIVLYADDVVLAGGTIASRLDAPAPASAALAGRA